jgi:Protein of unknown function (DUF3617)
MTFSKWAAVGAIAIMATAVASAQQKFPLRSGEWESSTSVGPGQAPFVMPFCLNDELWTKALNKNPSCSIQNLTVSSGGGSYNLDCPMKSFQMKGTVTLTFDGMTHMVSKASFDTTSKGQTTHVDSTSEWRWKGPVCNPDVDMNLKKNIYH